VSEGKHNFFVCALVLLKQPTKKRSPKEVLETFGQQLAEADNESPTREGDEGKSDDSIQSLGKYFAI